MPNPPAHVQFNSYINPGFNPQINPRANASLNPLYNPWINPERHSHIHPRSNRSLNPLSTSALNPTTNPGLDPKQTSKFSGLHRWTVDAELGGYVVNTGNKAVLLLFDEALEWRAFAVDNRQQGFNVFGVDGAWTGYLLKNAAGGLNEFDLAGNWMGFIMWTALTFRFASASTQVSDPDSTGSPTMTGLDFAKLRHSGDVDDSGLGGEKH
jgi:hypothetical protein